MTEREIMVVFRDRRDAGLRLAARLRSLPLNAPVVLGLPRGGIPVAYEVARSLAAPLELCLVRKIGAPGRPQMCLGAVTETGYVRLSPAVVDHQYSPEAVCAELVRARRELRALVKRLRAGRPLPDLAGHTAILVDDGADTGCTMAVAIQCVCGLRPRAIVLALPVAARDTLDALAVDVDRAVCLYTPTKVYAVGLWYSDYNQVSEADVADLVRRSRPQAA
jgi:putative phosphoribosyl transferase